jgi:hypothetical protein
MDDDDSYCQHLPKASDEEESVVNVPGDYSDSSTEYRDDNLKADEDASTDQQDAGPPISPSRYKHGTAVCDMCDKEFYKNTPNHKVCPDQKCQEKKEKQRTLQKRLSARKKTELKHKEALEKEARDSKAKEEAAKKKAKRKPAPAGQHSERSPKRRALGTLDHSSRGNKPGMEASAASKSKLAPAVLKTKPSSAQLTNSKAARRQDGNDGDVASPAPKGMGDRVRVNPRVYVVPSPHSPHKLIEDMLDWKHTTQTILKKGYRIIDLNKVPEAANMNIHCELMEERESNPWKSRVRQGWEDGRSLKLDEI